MPVKIPVDRLLRLLRGVLPAIEFVRRGALIVAAGGAAGAIALAVALVIGGGSGWLAAAMPLGALGLIPSTALLLFRWRLARALDLRKQFEEFPHLREEVGSALVELRKPGLRRVLYALTVAEQIWKLRGRARDLADWGGLVALLSPLSLLFTVAMTLAAAGVGALGAVSLLLAWIL